MTSFRDKAGTYLRNLRFLNGLRADVDDCRERIRSLERQQRLASRRSLTQLAFGHDPWLREARDKHAGQRCIVLGCGPSVRELQPSALPAGVIFATNGIALLPRFHIDYFVSVSKEWWRHHTEALNTLSCQRSFLPDYIEVRTESPRSVLRCILPEYSAHFAKTPWFFSQEVERYVVLGGSVVFVCLQLAFHFGFSEVVLLGMDHNYEGIDRSQPVFVGSDELPHFMPGYYNENTPVHVDIAAMERGYGLARAAFDEAGRRIINATPGTKLEVFERGDLKDLAAG